MKDATLYIDQYGGRVYARTRKELVSKADGGRVSIMYRDKLNGPPVRVGYVIGRLWFTAYAPAERPA